MLAIKPSPQKPIIGWWSGGITSAVACKIGIDLFGKENVHMIMQDTRNEDPDTYRFKEDCEKWYGMEIEMIDGFKGSPYAGDNEYECIDDVWDHFISLNVAHGAICSSELKRDVRKRWEKVNEYSAQIFGYDTSEHKRARGMTMNHPQASPLYTLLLMGLSKLDCLDIVINAGIAVPQSYIRGFLNNNCEGTGCIQGGIGYWQKRQRDNISQFDAMAAREHRLTIKGGKPVTILKDQSCDGALVFLKPHPDYPTMKDISMMKGRQPAPLMSCNGFCGIDDLSPDPSHHEVNFDNGEGIQVGLFAPVVEGIKQMEDSK